MGDISIKGRSPLVKGGRVGLKQGGAYGPLRGTSGPKQVAKAFRGKEGFKESQALQSKIVKGTPYRKEIAGYKRAHRTKQKILAGRAGRVKQAQQEAFKKKHIDPASKETKVKISKQIAPKSWRRAGKT